MGDGGLAAAEPGTGTGTGTGTKAATAHGAETPVAPGGVALSPTSRVESAAPLTPAPASTPPTPAAAPLNAQLAPTLLNLRTAPSGTHLITLTVSPDEVGPVTVRAHVAADGIRIELSAPTEQGRDALGAMMTELRRDLSQGGMNAGLSLASPQADASGAGQQPWAGAGAGGSPQRDTGSTRPDTTLPELELSRPASPITRIGATTALDVFA
jgi:flagellar hook-length control protein FliK